jgi:hypothetical protein
MHTEAAVNRGGDIVVVSLCPLSSNPLFRVSSCPIPYLPLWKSPTPHRLSGCWLGWQLHDVWPPRPGGCLKYGTHNIPTRREKERCKGGERLVQGEVLGVIQETDQVAIMFVCLSPSDDVENSVPRGDFSAEAAENNDVINRKR